MSARDPRGDAYLSALSADQQRLLEGVRATIRRVVPDAEETIAYDMPAFRLAGRFLVSYAGRERHCSVYPLTDSFLAAHAVEIEGFGRTKGSIHFTAAKPLPPAFVNKLIPTRVAGAPVE